MNVLKHTVLLALACSTVFVSGAAGQSARLNPESALLRAAVGSGSMSVSAVRRPAAPRYDVVVLRVEFQPDTTRFTTGQGTFDGALYAEGLLPSIDPLPHDADYVEAHLSFLRDYVHRSSDGKTTLTTWLLPEIVRVSGQMGDYSPTGPDAGSDRETAKLAKLVTEAWELASPQANAVMKALDPDRTAFLIVHAGVGRDLELVGTTLDKTPQDLPSLFFDSDALDRLDPGPRATFGGIPVNHGIIVPRTETRQGFNFIDDSPFLAEFSVNGLLAASFFNFLGVPDLFDTSTGKSAIGPFGLMDGLGIFAYSGLFPPEPSAWTKYYLGWVAPPEMVPDSTYQVTFAGGVGGPQAVRASISEAEYFLVENRQRDPENDGVVLQVWNQGQVSEVRFANGATDFNSSTVQGFPGGVVVSADQYDYALPGGIDEDGFPLVGGMLIWHIDERVIEENLASNTVNANARRRGVDVEEADSAQDIGFPIGGLFGPSFDLGSPFDFFYDGNPVATITSTGAEVRLYQNRFGANTYPNSAANDGGASFLELSDFSTPSPSMSVRLTRTPERGLTALGSINLGSVDPGFDQQGLVRFVGSNGLMAFSGGAGQLFLLADRQTIGRLDGLLAAEPAVASSIIWAATSTGFVGLQANGQFVDGGAFPAPVQQTTTPIVAASGLRGASLSVGAVTGGQDVVITTGSNGPEMLPQPSRVLGLPVVDENEPVLVLADRAKLDSRNVEWVYPLITWTGPVRPVFGRDRKGVFGVVPDPGAATLHMLWPDGTTQSVDVKDFSSTRMSGRPSLADLDNDGLLDVLVATGDHLLGFSRSGAVVNGFPIPTRARGVGAPVVVDEDQNRDRFYILTMAADGQVDAYEPGSTRPVAGFPISIGTTASAGVDVRAGRILAMSASGYLTLFQSDLLGEPRSGPQLGGESNASFVDIAPETTTLLDTPRLLVPGESYNWPNPVREGETRFRFLPTEDVSISILVVDAAGSEIDRLELAFAPAEIPSEAVWRTTAQSGVYFARIRARSVDGRTEDSLIKVAIIR